MQNITFEKIPYTKKYMQNIPHAKNTTLTYGKISTATKYHIQNKPIANKYHLQKNTTCKKDHTKKYHMHKIPHAKYATCEKYHMQKIPTTKTTDNKNNDTENTDNKS